MQKSKKNHVYTYAINICKVKTDVWQRRLMKWDASKRHSEENFLEVKPTDKIRTNPIFLLNLSLTHHNRNSTRIDKLVIILNRIAKNTYPIRQKLSKNPTSVVTSFYWHQPSSIAQNWLIQHTKFIICSNFVVTSRDEDFASRTSRIANMPCAETSWLCISGASNKIPI